MGVHDGAQRSRACEERALETRKGRHPVPKKGWVADDFEGAG